MAFKGPSRFSRLLKAFATNENGAFSVVFIVAVLPILAMVGLAVDYSRLTKLEAQLQNMADSASVAAAVAVKTNPSANYVLKAEHFKSANTDKIDITKVNYTVTKDTTARTVTVDLSTTVGNYFGIFLGKRFSQLSTRSVANYDTLPPMELAIVFDVTGSMKYIGNGDSGSSVPVPKPGSKARQAQKGLKKFLEKLKAVADVRAALVPFATVVKIDADSTRYKPWLNWSASSVANVSTTAWEGCLVDRDKDVGPFVSQYDARYPATTCKKDHWNATRWTGSKANDVSNFTSDLGELKSRIDGLQFDGCTNITLGAYWGGVMLDPQRPIAGAANWGDRKKIMLLMSDGMNTTDRWTSIPDAGECARKESMDPLTIDTCSAIKSKNIEIYAINVVNGDPHVLEECASGPDHYFYASNAAKVAEHLEALTDEMKKRTIVRLVN
ncbi:Tad domain-containing protein [Alsobacter sp. KACC 23698]|uniref:Tad domain-containing protein n=1 Tax=Alsobacter sp. KACC 23698 TaxID=3149229 RepID=A0AAU7JH69_9HYPH